jgi:hypothetical protein
LQSAYRFGDGGLQLINLRVRRAFRVRDDDGLEFNVGGGGGHGQRGEDGDEQGGDEGLHVCGETRCLMWVVYRVEVMREECERGLSSVLVVGNEKGIGIGCLGNLLE